MKPCIIMLGQTYTKPWKIRSALRQMWLRSRERATALKNSGYKCEKCGVKASKAKGREQKIEVHHKEGIGNWDKVIALIQDELLCDAENLQCLCPNCHREETYK